MEYKFSDNTLLHGIGFNFFKLESIFNYGLVSLREAEKQGIRYSKNYSGFTPNNMISMVRGLYVNPEVKDGSYHKYITKGISFIIEDVPFISDTSSIIIHRPDEVYVKDKILQDKIQGIIIPEETIDMNFEDLPYIATNSESYLNTKNSCELIREYLTEYGYNMDMEEYQDYLRELRAINKACENLPKMEENFEELREEFHDSLMDFNAFIGHSFKECFKKVLGKENIKPIDVVHYMSSKYNAPIYIQDLNRTEVDEVGRK